MTSKILSPAPKGFAHRFKRVDGLRFHYIDGGREDAPVLVLPGRIPSKQLRLA